MELTVLLALTMQYLLAAPLFTSSFLFHAVISAKQDGMLTPDKVTPRGGTQKEKTALVYLANILCAAKSDARAAAVTAQREGQDGRILLGAATRGRHSAIWRGHDGRILLGATAGWRETAN